MTTQPKTTDGVYRVSDGVLLDTSFTTTATLTSNRHLSRAGSFGLVFTISATVNGNFTIKYVDRKDHVRTLQGSTAYTANAFTVVTFAHHVREAYVEFTPGSATGSVTVEAFQHA